MIVPRPAAALMLAAALAVGGCETLGLGGGDDNNNDRPIASSADTKGRTVADGKGVRSFAAPSDGTVRLYDTDRDELIYEGPLRRGQTFKVTPDDDKAEVDGDTVYDRNLERDDRHRITFAPESRDDKGDRAEGNAKPSGVPDEAGLIRTVKGDKPYTYRPDRDGVAYVVDADRNRLVTKQRVGEGENLTIHLAKDTDRLSVDGKAVGPQLDRRGTYRVYWQKYQVN